MKNKDNKDKIVALFSVLCAATALLCCCAISCACYFKHWANAGTQVVPGPATVELAAQRAQNRLPPGWAAMPDYDSGKTYYFNVVTHETTWTIPSQSFGQAAGSGGVLPQGWVEVNDSTCKCHYYYNTQTNVTQWERPA